MVPVLLFAFVAGLLTIVASCTLPVLPVIIGGGVGPGRRRLLGLGLGFAGTFIAFTFVLASSLAELGFSASALRWIAALVLGTAGLTLALPGLARLVQRVTAGRASPTRALGPGARTAPGCGGVWPSGARWAWSGRPAPAR